MYNRGESISGAVVCQILRNLKIPLEIYDIHSNRLHHYLPFKDRSILPALLKEIPKKNLLVISPDKGGLRRAQLVADTLKTKALAIEKVRDKQEIHMSFSGHVEGKDILIVDDMISTGTTLLKAVNLLKKNGAADIYCIAAHGLFVGDAAKRLSQSPIKKIVVSNSFPLKSHGKISVVPMEKVIV